MEGVAGGNQPAGRGGGTISRYTSWLLGGSGNRYHLPQSQSVSADYRNERWGPLWSIYKPPEGIWHTWKRVVHGYSSGIWIWFAYGEDPQTLLGSPLNGGQSGSLLQNPVQGPLRDHPGVYSTPPPYLTIWLMWWLFTCSCWWQGRKRDRMALDRRSSGWRSSFTLITAFLPSPGLPGSKRRCISWWVFLTGQTSRPM